MFLLTSDGLSSQVLQDFVKQAVPDGGKAGIIITASHIYREKDKHVPRLKKELMDIGLAVDLFDLDKQGADKLEQYDVIEIMGGNPFYLLNRMRETECKPVLLEFAAKKCVIGVSGGSLVLQKSINLVAGFSPEMNDEVGLDDFTGLELVSVELLPHYSRYQERFERFEERTRQYELKNGVHVIRLEDGQGVIPRPDGGGWIL